MNILEALDDPKLFKPWTRGFDMTAWRAYHAAVFGLPMSTVEAGIYRAATGRLSLPGHRALEVYAPVGRRGGKSANAALLAVFMTAIETSWQQHLAPGQQAVFPIISVDRQAGLQVLNYCTGILNSTPLLKSMIESEGKEEIILKNGAIIQIRTASFRSIRGPAYIGAVLDELAFFRDNDTAANPASEIIAAISPAIVENGVIFGISSVFNRQGILYEQFQEHFGRDDDEVLVWKAGTLTMNPGFSVKKIERDKAKDAKVAAAEYDSEWRDDISSLYAAQDVEAAMVPGRGDLPKAPRVRYFAFVDPSGGRRDSAALAIAHSALDGRIIVDLTKEIKAPHQPGEVVAEFAGVVKGYGCMSVTGDRYGGQWPAEAYDKRGIDYCMAEKTSSELYLAALPLFTGHQIELPDNDRLKNQLLSLMRRTNQGGRDSVVAGQGDGSHCDLANAVAGAIWLASQDSCHDQQGAMSIGGANRLRAASFADTFIPQQSADDWLWDR